MQPNLIAWLSPYAGSTGAIWPHPASMFHHALRPVRKDAGLAKWPMRCDIALQAITWRSTRMQPPLALDMEHATTDMIFSNYRELVLPAERYFRIFPPRLKTLCRSRGHHRVAEV